MTNDPNSFLMGSGGRSATFPAIGTQYDGFITSYELRQQTDFKSGKPMTWDDGNPRMQLVVTLRTELKDDDDDDGMRTLYIKGQMQKAVRDAVSKAGAKGITHDGRLFVRFISEGEAPGKGLNAPKNYIVKYAPPVQAVPADGPEDGSEPF